MERYRQYKLMKKVEKFLDKPAPEPEIYEGNPSNTYIGTRKGSEASAGAHAISTAHPDQDLRLSQVRQVSELILNMLDMIESMKASEGSVSVVKDFAASADATDDRNDALRQRIVHIEVSLQEVKMGLLFTDAEKVAKSEDKLSSINTGKMSVQRVSKDDATALRTRIQVIQAELKRRKRSILKIEQMLRDLGVNVNDARCVRISKDQKDAETGMKRTLNDATKVMCERFETIKSMCVR